MPFPPEGWPPRLPSNVRVLRFFTKGVANSTDFGDFTYLFESGNKASATIGEGDVNRLVLVSIDAAGASGNNYQVEVVRPTSGHPAALAATLANQVLTISLATAADGTLNALANTATLVTAAINLIVGVTAVANGTGATALDRIEPRKNFFGGGGLMLPTPYVPPGGASTIARAGDRYRGGPPLGGGRHDIDPNRDPYGPPVPAVWTSNIQIYNDDPVAANSIDYSFDGVNVHGTLFGGEKAEFWRKEEAGIAVRRGLLVPPIETPPFRIFAW
jgi:hypothetical protein